VRRRRPRRLIFFHFILLQRRSAPRVYKSGQVTKGPSGRFGRRWSRKRESPKAQKHESPMGGPKQKKKKEKRKKEKIKKMKKEKRKTKNKK